MASKDADEVTIVKEVGSFPVFGKCLQKKQVASNDADEVTIVKEVGSFPVFGKCLQKKKEQVELPRPPNVEDGNFPEYPDWFLAGRTIISALSTTKGRRLVDNEIVHFDFQSAISKRNSKWILRISTKRSGEVGLLCTTHTHLKLFPLNSISFHNHFFIFIN